MNTFSLLTPDPSTGRSKRYNFQATTTSDVGDLNSAIVINLLLENRSLQSTLDRLIEYKKQSFVGDTITIEPIQLKGGHEKSLSFGTLATGVWRMVEGNISDGPIFLIDNVDSSLVRYHNLAINVVKAAIFLERSGFLATVLYLLLEKGKVLSDNDSANFICSFRKEYLEFRLSKEWETDTDHMRFKWAFRVLTNTSLMYSSCQGDVGLGTIEKDGCRITYVHDDKGVYRELVGDLAYGVMTNDVSIFIQGRESKGMM